MSHHPDSQTTPNALRDRARLVRETEYRRTWRNDQLHAMLGESLALEYISAFDAAQRKDLRHHRLASATAALCVFLGLFWISKLLAVVAAALTGLFYSGMAVLLRALTLAELEADDSPPPVSLSPAALSCALERVGPGALDASLLTANEVMVAGLDDWLRRRTTSREYDTVLALAGQFTGTIAELIMAARASIHRVP